MTSAAGTDVYTYDDLYRLTVADHPSATDENYTYDKVGNRETSAAHNNWQYDHNNRLTSYNAGTFTYDANGNMLTNSARSATYTYDEENRMDTFTDGSTTASYEYDPFGKRLSKTVNGTTRYFLYDDEDIIVEYDSSGNVMADYWHGQGIDEPVRMTRGSTDYYYTFDGLGSVRDLTSASQVVQESYDYDAFGNIVSAPLTGNPYTYTSREYDPESELYFYRARTYDPSIGRFLQADPIKFGGGVNWYTYVENNPIFFTDPEGKWPHCTGAPDTISGFNFGPACQNHDQCCACTGDRAECEKKFSQDLGKACAGEVGWRRRLCISLAATYASAAQFCFKNEKDCEKCKAN